MKTVAGDESDLRTGVDVTQLPPVRQRPREEPFHKGGSFGSFTGTNGRNNQAARLPITALVPVKTSALSVACLVSMIAVASCNTGVGNTIPANAPDAAALRHVAVLEFTGNSGDETASALEAALVAHRVDNAAYFTVVDRTMTTGGTRGEIAPATAARLGKKLDVQGVFLGRVNSNINSTSHTEKQFTCTQYNPSGGCHHSSHIPVRCTDVTATVSVMPRLVSVASGRVVYAQERTGTAMTSYCSGQSQDESNDMLLSRARDEAISEILRDVAPHPKSVGDYLGESIKSLMQ